MHWLIIMKVVHQRRSVKNAIAMLKDAQNKFRKEEFALVMGQRSNYAVLKNAQIELKMEECPLGMVQHGQRSDALLKDVQIKPSMEECALDMEQRSNYVESMGAQIKFREEECA